MGMAVEDLDLFLAETPAFLSIHKTCIAAERAVGAYGEVIFGKAVGDKKFFFSCGDLFEFRAHKIGRNRKVISLKDMLEELRLYVLKDLYLINAPFSFGATTTSLGDIQVKSEFYFCNVTPHSIVTSNANGVATTVKNADDNLYSTFIQLENSEMLSAFLKATGIESKSYEAAPEWFQAIKMFDDNDQLDRIAESQRLIAEQKQKITEANASLDRNNRWKSILYTQGAELVEVVFDALHELLGVDLSAFEDKKREDSRVEAGDQIANMSKLDFLLLLWEARIVGEDYVEANT